MFYAQSVLPVREYGKMVRTPLAAFFNSPIHSLRTFGINRLIGAIPLGPTETINRVQPLVDHLEVLYMPDPFITVGAHYQHFPQVEDQQVLTLLRTAQHQSSDPMPRPYPSL